MVAILIVAVDNAHDLYLLEELRVVEEHHHKHRKIAEGVRDIEVDLIAILQDIVDCPEGFPDVLLCSALRDTNAPDLCAEPHAVKLVLKPEILILGLGKVIDPFIDRPGPVLPLCLLGEEEAHQICAPPFLCPVVLQGCALNEAGGRRLKISGVIAALVVKACAEHGKEHLPALFRLSSLLCVLCHKALSRSYFLLLFLSWSSRSLASSLST